jgi:Ca2+/Na+ antiporter
LRRVCSALISDFASTFGCLVGMTDVVTSISIVALGTSLPDTFASMLAIQADDNADNAIGNVTGRFAAKVVSTDANGSQLPANEPATAPCHQEIYQPC